MHPDFYSAKSICILFSWKGKTDPVVWTGLAHRKSATSFSHSHAEVQTWLIIWRSPSPPCNYHISCAGWPPEGMINHTVKFRELQHVILHYVPLELFPFPMLQLPIQLCFSFLFVIISLLCRNSLPAFWLPNRTDSTFYTLCRRTYLGFQEYSMAVNLKSGKSTK